MRSLYEDALHGLLCTCSSSLLSKHFDHGSKGLHSNGPSNDLLAGGGGGGAWGGGGANFL